MTRIQCFLAALMLSLLNTVCLADAEGYVGRVDVFAPRYNQIVVDDIAFRLATGLRVLDEKGRQVSMLSISKGLLIRYKPEGYPEKANNGGTIYEISILPKGTKIRQHIDFDG